MKALVKYSLEPNCVELREVPEPVIGPHDVLMRTAACGVCGSDLELARGTVSYKVKVPVILGHEFAGKVEAVGDAVEGFAVGDHLLHLWPVPSVSDRQLQSLSRAARVRDPG